MREEIGGDHVPNPSTTADSHASRALVIDVTQLADRMCVRVHGELDDASAPLLRDRLACFISEPLGDLVLDIGGLTFLDSSGLGLFAILHKKLANRGQQLILCNPTPMAE